MKVRPFHCLLFPIFAWLNLSGQSGSTRPFPNEGSFGRLPFIFEANRGQAGNTANFLARGADYSVLLESNKTEIVLSAPLPGKEKMIGFRPRLSRSGSLELVRAHGSRQDNRCLARATTSSESNHRTGFSAYHSTGR
jgi:hypothetical protein